MMIRFAVYLLAVFLSLGTLAVGLVEILFRSQVLPKLESDRVTQEKAYQPYLGDLAFLDTSTLIKMKHSGLNDAGVFLNPKTYWAPHVIGARGAANPLVPITLREELIRMHGDWLRKFPRVRAINPDLSLFTGLSRFDHWDIEVESPISDLTIKNHFVPPFQIPVPETSDLIALVKLRLMSGALKKDYLGSLSDVRELARLMLTTENTQLVIAGLAALDHERFAYRTFVASKKIEAAAWVPIDRNFTHRAHRAVLATRSFLHLWTRPEKLERIFLSDPAPVGFCAAVNEAFPSFFSLRKNLEPRWPFEMSLKSEYAKTDAILKRAEGECRLRYLRALVAAKAFPTRTPGPLILSRLPYSRKIFALRLSVISFTGFDDYKLTPSPM